MQVGPDRFFARISVIEASRVKYDKVYRRNGAAAGASCFAKKYHASAIQLKYCVELFISLTSRHPESHHVLWISLTGGSFSRSILSSTCMADERSTI